MAARRLIRGPLFWSCVGALFMVTVGPILFGAVGTFFWSLPSDGPRADNAAAERLFYSAEIDLENFPVNDLRFRIMGPYGGKCINPVGQIERAHLVSDTDALMDIQDDLRGAEVDRIVSGARRGPLEYLVKLPRPVLGGLDNCVTHSLFAPVCASITRSLLAQHSTEMMRYFEHRFAQARARADAESCVLLGLAGIGTAKLNAQTSR